MDNKLYEYLKSDFETIFSTKLSKVLPQLNHSSFLITGATGLIGKYLSYFLIYLVEKKGFDLDLTFSSYGEAELNQAFGFSKASVHLLPGDITKGLPFDGKADYVIHLASNANPALYMQKPIDTELGIIVGTNNVLSLASKSNSKRVFFASTTDVYGNPIKSGPLSEDDIGVFNCNSLRGIYNEAKRAAESLCQGWISEKGLDVVIGRFSRLFGPTANFNSSLASVAFFKKAVLNEPIEILKPTTARYSFTYVGNAVAAILHLLICGKSGQAYNIATKDCLAEVDGFAKQIITGSGSQSDIIYKSERTKGHDVILETGKLEASGFEAPFGSNYGIEKTAIKLKAGLF